MSGAIASLFWWQDLQYSRPTPVPGDWVQVSPGASVRLPEALASLTRGTGRPVLLHFFNPACPCSRFNVEHVRDLARAYQDRVTIVAVLVQDAPHVLEQAYRTLDLDIPFYVDDGRAAASVGAYSTPQAAILDRAGRLFYRGNYNVSRYCRDRETQFARLALEAALAGRPPGPMPAAATTAYGCPLTGNRRRTLKGA